VLGVYSSSSGENEFAAPLSPSPVVFRLVRLGNTQSVAGIDHRRRISAMRRGLSPVLDDGRNWYGKQVHNVINGVEERSRAVGLGVDG
jgi:hypothetical protein